MPAVTLSQLDRAVVAGQRYQYSVYTGAINALVDAYMSVYNNSGTLLDTIVLTGAAANDAEKPGGPTLADFKRIGFFYTMPATATKATVSLRKNATKAGQTESWGFFTRVVFGEATPDQTVFSPYQAGSVAKTTFATIAEESSARITSDTATATAITQLTANVGANSAAIVTEQTARTTADSALASSVTTLTSRLATRPNLLKNGGFENGLANWTLTGGGGAAAQYLDIPGWGPGFELTGTAIGSGNLLSDMFSVVAGEKYTIAGDSQLVYASGTGSTSYFDLVWYSSTGALLSDSAENLHNTSHDFATGDANRTLHAAALIAPAGATQAAARFVWDGTAITKVGVRQVKVERGDLPYTPYSQEVSLQVQSTVTNGLSAQYTIKVDNNGYISGYGFASTPSSSGPISSFAVRADSFYIASPTGGGINPAMPFIVRTTPTTINGVAVPVGVYITDAFIQNGTITSAMIGNAMITTAKIANLAVTTALIGDAQITTAKIGDAQITTAKIGDAQITTAKIVDLTVTAAKIANATITTAKIGNAQITAALIADANITAAKIADANITNAKIANAAVTNAKIGGDIQSDTWNGATGWMISKSGAAYFERVVIYGVQSGAVGVPNNGTGQVIHNSGRYIAISLWSPSGNVAMTSLDGSQFTVRLDNSAGGTVYYAYV